MNANKIRMPVDITMTLLSIILMGGAYLFPSDIIHEILGMALFLLWAVHITLNRRWYSSIFRGKYNARRIMQTVINCAILICVIFLMISGIILSWRYLILQQKFFFLDFERGYFLFALDYISIIILFATVIHYINKLPQKGA